jgi:hypothetical protein
MRLPTARRIASERDKVAQLWPARREPDASPTRNALSVAANAVALEPDA